MYKIYQVYFDDDSYHHQNTESLVIASTLEEAITSWSYYQHYKDLGLEEFIHAWEYDLTIENIDDFNINVEITKKGDSV